MQSHFEIQLVESYYGTPIVEVRCTEPTVLTEETAAELAGTLTAQPYPEFAVILSFRNLSFGQGFGPEEEADLRGREPFVALSKRIVATVRYDTSSLTSLIQGMRVNMLLRHSKVTNFAPDFDSALRIVRRAIDRTKVLAP